MDFLNNLIGSWESILLGAVAFFAAWYLLKSYTNLADNELPLYLYSAIIAFVIVLIGSQVLPGVFGGYSDESAM
jgi:hypothetical protein